MRILLTMIAVLAVACSVITDPLGVSRSALSDSTIYDAGVLNQVWHDASEAPHKLVNTKWLHDGDPSLSASLSWEQFIAFENLNGLPADAVSFEVNGCANAALPSIKIFVADGQAWYQVPSIAQYCEGGVIPTGAWTSCSVPLTAFGLQPGTTITGVSFDGPSTWIKPIAFSDIELDVGTGTGNGGAGGSSGGEAGHAGDFGSGGSQETGGSSEETGGFGGVPDGGGAAGTAGVEAGGMPGASGSSGASSGASSGGASTSTGGQETGGQGGAPIAASVGAHALYARPVEQGSSYLETAPVDTQSGSMFLVGVGRGEFNTLATMLPQDNRSNQYAQIVPGIRYDLWNECGASLYSASGDGGLGHVFSTSLLYWDEVTLAAVEVVGGRAIKDLKSQYVFTTNGNEVVSPSVTTTGPAAIVAYAWGDSGGPDYFTVNNGFDLLDIHPAEDGSSIQCVTAGRTVSQAGSYSVTFTHQNTLRGAIVFIAAVTS